MNINGDSATFILQRFSNLLRPCHRYTNKFSQKLMFSIKRQEVCNVFMKKIIFVMKKMLLGVSIIALFAGAYACSRGSLKQMSFIKNTDKTMDEMKAEAKLQKKILFVDIYTTWCGPCKWMDENTFKDSRVAEKFNKTFLNYKVDGESFEGVNVGINYRVDAFPTYLFIGPDGTVINRIEGMISADALIKEADFVSRRNANSNATR